MLLQEEEQVKKGSAVFKPLYLSTAIFFTLWLLLFWPSIYSAAQVWYISDIFNHCFFVIPGAFYLIYRQRHVLANTPLEPNYWAIIPIVGLLCLYAVGEAGDVQVFMHAATFTLLPVFLWCLWGTKVSLKLAFPLLFILFAIPVGEELIPWLQEVTATVAVFLLNQTNVPIFRNGLYIEIPQGRFLVAEACSGISFFIASIVIGTLYSHLNIVSLKRKSIFISISVLYPILANAIRVYGIILTGYLSDMQYAVGADHLIYGWFFFLLVIISLFFIGELIREKGPILEIEQDHYANKNSTLSYKPLMITLALFGVFQIWYFGIAKAKQSEHSSAPNLTLAHEDSAYSGYVNWHPAYLDSAFEKQGRLDLNGMAVDYFYAWYPGGQGELISSLNRLYLQDAWTLKSAQQIELPGGHELYQEQITNPRDSFRLLVSWFVVAGEPFASKLDTKLFQIKQLLLGQPIEGAVIAFSIEVPTDSQQRQVAKEHLLEYIENNYQQISQQLAKP